MLACLTETVTAAGTRLLADIVAAPLADALAINSRLDVVSFFYDDEKLLQQLQTAFKAMPDLERALAVEASRPQHTTFMPKALPTLATLLPILP